MGQTLLVREVLGSPLRGKIDGRKHFGFLCAALSGAQRGSVVRLDFGGVEDVSASWIAAALLPLLDWSAAPANDLYPVLAGVQRTEKKWEDELELVATRGNAVFLIADPMVPAWGHFVGDLDPILTDTLRLVQKHREVTGAGLKRLVPSKKIGATAWSNRLRDLHTKRLVRRWVRGREAVYLTVLEVNFDGPAGSAVADRELPP